MFLRTFLQLPIIKINTYTCCIHDATCIFYHGYSHQKAGKVKNGEQKLHPKDIRDRAVIITMPLFFFSFCEKRV